MASCTLPRPTAASAPAQPVACGRRGAVRPAAVLAWFALVVLASLLLAQEIPAQRSGAAAVASAAVDVSGALPQFGAVAPLPPAGRTAHPPAAALESSVALLAAAALCLTLVRRLCRPRLRMPGTRRLRVPAGPSDDAAAGRNPIFAARAADTNNAMLAPTDGVSTSRCPRSRPACRP